MFGRVSVLKMIFCQKLSHVLETSAYPTVGAGKNGLEVRRGREVQRVQKFVLELSPNLPSLKESWEIWKEILEFSAVQGGRATSVVAISKDRWHRAGYNLFSPIMFRSECGFKTPKASVDLLLTRSSVLYLGTNRHAWDLGLSTKQTEILISKTVGTAVVNSEKNIFAEYGGFISSGITYFPLCLSRVAVCSAIVGHSQWEAGISLAL